MSLSWTSEQITWIREKYAIDSTTGRITHRRASEFNTRLMGELADNVVHKATGYRVMRITCPGMKPKKRVIAHRIAWILYYNEAPPHEIDHVNKLKTDNSFGNLRAATDNQNARNINKREEHGGKPCSSNFKGVSRYRGRWRAYIHVESRQTHLGIFDTELEAATAYNEAAVKLHNEFASVNSLTSS